MKHFIAFLALAACVPLAAAQQHAPRPSSADPAARVPPAAYHSAFAGYVPYREQELAVWREVNDEVARIGGHVKMFGGAGHAGHGDAKPAKPAPGQAAASKEPAARPPARTAPQAPQGGHQGH